MEGYTVVNELSSLAALDGVNLTKTDLNLLRATIHSYLIKVNKIIDQFEEEKNKLEKRDEDKSPTAIAWAAARDTKDLSSTTLQEGFLLVEKIRRIFTGQEIEFSVLVPYYGKLYLRKLKLEDFIKKTGLSIDYSTGNLKLQITKAKYGLLEIDKGRKLLSKEEEKLNNIENIPNSKVLYNQLMSERKSFGANRGHVAEILVKYKLTHKTFPKKELSKKYIEKMFTDVKSNIVGGFKAGDYGNIQIKNYNASLATLNYIVSILHSLDKAFVSESLENIKETLKKSFINSTAKDKIDRSFAQTAEENIDKIFQNIK